MLAEGREALMCGAGGRGPEGRGRRAAHPACLRAVPFLSFPHDPAVNPAEQFDYVFVDSSKTLPVVLGELGPVSGLMNSTDAEAAMRLANNLSLPWTAFSLHMRCPPNMLQDLSNNGCGVGMPLRLTDWGLLVQKYINL